MAIVTDPLSMAVETGCCRRNQPNASGTRVKTSTASRGAAGVSGLRVGRPFLAGNAGETDELGVDDQVARLEATTGTAASTNGTSASPPACSETTRIACAGDSRASVTRPTTDPEGSRASRPMTSNG